ncbi:Transcription elongation factor SPT6 [Diplonema papillatum]|nr:Transcription elongation factor SPT6 [Diplonema papillatum]
MQVGSPAKEVPAQCPHSALSPAFPPNQTTFAQERDRIRQEEAQRQAESIEKMLTTAREGKLDMDADGDDEPGVTLDNLSDVIGAEAEPEEQDLDYEEDVRLANKFFGIEEDAETDAVDRLEQQAFQEIAKDEGEVEDALETVIPPEDMKRLYLRKVDERIQKTDLPERYQLQLDSVLWSQNELMEKLFEPGPDNIMQKMTMFIYVRVFRNSIHTPKVITQVLTYIFKFGNEPVFVQRYCMLRDKAEESVTLDDVWNIWNTAFEFLEIYNRREQLKDGLLPVHEAMAEGLYRTITEQNFRFAAATRDSKVGMARRVEDGLDSLSYDMYNVSFAELSTKSGQNKWTWLPHYLTWMEKWITHWDDLFTRVCSKEKTQVAYRMNTERTRIPVRRNDAVRLRAQRLYYFALQFTAHPSTLAYYLTLSGNSDYAKAITGAANVNDPSSLPDLDPEEWKIVEGIQHMTLTKPSLPPRDFFAGHAQEANSWYGTDFWGSDPYTAGEALQEACCTMIAGSLAVEPRFKQVLLELLLGQEDMSVMSLGKLRVQPSANGFGFFKQGGQARVGYRNVCLNSRKFTSQLKEEIVKYAHSGLMVWWIECDDPAVVKQEIENEFLKQDAMDGAASLSASSRVPSTTATAMTQQHEVGRLNQKREALSEAVKISEADVWYPSEQTFEQFKDGIRGKKVKIISRVLRDAHRDSGKVNLSKLPFIPLDEWYTKSNSWESIEQARDRVTPDRLAELVCEHQWAELRAGIIEKAVELALDDVEQTVWDSICLEVKEKALVDSAAGLRKMVLRAGYAPYKLKLQAGDTNDAAQQRLLLDEEMFHQNEATDFAPDLSDKTLPGRQRVAGVVYDDVRKQHTICFLDEFGNYLDSFELHHLVMREEDPLVREKLDDMQIRLRKAIYTHRPAAWALGMSDSSDLRVREMLRKFNVDWQAMLEDRDLCKLLPPNFKPPKIEMVDSRIARVWARSRAAAVELRDLDESRKKAVSVGRTLRSPLSAVASLFTADMDALNLALCEMQDVAPRLPLLRRLEQQMVSIVAVVGLDINGLLKERARSEQGLVQFLPGFGPRKATGLLRSVAGTSVEIVRRHELTASPFDITPRMPHFSFQSTTSCGQQQD